MTKTKSLFSLRIFAETLKEVKYITLFHIILLFCVTTLPVYLEFIGEIDMMVSFIDYSGRIERLVGFTPLIFICMIGMVLFEVVYVFSYLFKNNGTQFYNSMPFKRECMFTSKAAACFVSIFVPVVIVLVVNSIILGKFVPVEAFEFYGYAAKPMMWAVVLSYACSFSASLLAVSVAGNVLGAVFSLGFMALGSPMTVIAATLCCETWFENIRIDPEGSPGYLFAPFVIINAEQPIDWLWFVWTGVISLGLLVAAFFAYKLRKSENNSRFIVFKPLGAFFSYYTSFIASLGFGAFFVYSGSGAVVCAMAYGAIFVLSYCILTAVFEKNVRYLFKNLKVAVIVGAVWGILLIPGVLGIFEPATFNPHLVGKVTVDTSDIVFTTKDKQVKKMASECVRLSVDSDKGQWFDVTVESFVPCIGIVFEDCAVPYEKLDELEEYISYSKEYREAINSILLDRYKFTDEQLYVDNAFVYTLHHERDMEILNIIASDITRFDRKTEEESGEYGHIRVATDLYYYTPKTKVKIYNCYKDTVEYIEKYFLEVKE